MQQIPLLAGELRAHLRCALEQAPEQALGAARARLAAAQSFLQHAVDRVAPVLARPQLPSRDDEGMPPARGHRGHMDLAQVDASDCSAGSGASSASGISTVRQRS
jgi:hypothetical protein